MVRGDLDVLDWPDEASCRPSPPGPRSPAPQARAFRIRAMDDDDAMFGLKANLGAFRQLGLKSPVIDFGNFLPKIAANQLTDLFLSACPRTGRARFGFGMLER
jgi:hypothetical protein